MFSRVAGSGLIALLVATAPLAAQQRVLTGRVVGAQSKRPIAEASVVVVGGSGARTSGDGKFNLPAPAGQVQLTIRAIGFVRKTLAVSATETHLEIELAEDIFRLEEIVTTGQATSITKRNATTASVTVFNRASPASKSAKKYSKSEFAFACSALSSTCSIPR